MCALWFLKKMTILYLFLLLPTIVLGKTVGEKFADIQILQYQIDGFENLTLKQKIFAYYLSEAGMSGRDIAWDQNYRYNLTIRKTLEIIYNNYKGNRKSEEFQKFVEYTKRVWFANGIHHHYSSDKFIPEFTPDFFRQLVQYTPSPEYPTRPGESVRKMVDRLIPIMFDPKIDAKKTNKNPEIDMVVNSAVNFYRGVTEEEVKNFYSSLVDPNDPTPPSWGLNSKLIKKNGKLKELVWSQKGMYRQAIDKIVYWLKKAEKTAENETQKRSIQKLIQYYQSGDLRIFDEYNILWVSDNSTTVDFINGFIESYTDPLNHKGMYESVVTIKNRSATDKFSVLGKNAQWFEDHSPIMEQHKKKSVTGISYNIISVVSETGDSSPSTPIGINLPNSNWIREKYGSKSISLRNIEEAYDKASENNGVLQEFYLPELQNLIKMNGQEAGLLATGLHEVIGHASGVLEEGVQPASVTLKNYASTLEEARADLVALYYIGDPYLVEIGVSSTTEIVKAEYITYITNGLLRQLVRIAEGSDIEEDHMRNRQLISKWVYERALLENVIEKVVKDEKTYIKINDYSKLRTYFGELLREIQRIKSQGDYEAGKHLVENYGVKVDPVLHKEVLERWKKLNVAPFSGFINPVLKPRYDKLGNIIDVKVFYPHDFSMQMLYYTKKYSFLPYDN